VTLITLLAILSGVAFSAYGALCLTTDSMKSEFERFGLGKLRVLTGALELLGGIGLLVGLWWLPARLMASTGLTALMFLGVGVRIKVKDTFVQSLPAVILMLVNLYILIESWPTPAG
jgi:DoxX-like family